MTPPLHVPGTTQEAACTVDAGLAHHHAGRLDQARAHYEQALALMPQHADALHLLGVVAMQQQRYADALDLIGRAIEISPQSTYFDNLGNALRGWGKLAAAAESHQQAIALDARNFRAHNNLGNVLHQMRLPAAAAASFRTAVELNPNFAEAQSNLGNVLRELGDWTTAETHCRRAIALNPAFGEAHNNLGNALKQQGRLLEAVQCYERAQQLMPHEPQVPLNLGIVKREMGFHDAAIACFREALLLRPGSCEVWSNLLFSLSFSQDTLPADYLAEARRFGELVGRHVQPYTDWCIDEQADAPLRIGFVSGDFRAHPVGYFLESVLGELDRSRVQLYAYSTRLYEDAVTERLKPHFASWRSLVELDDAAAARTIRDDGIQILVDLAGHTDANRLTVFAYKSAPVQMSWLGYFASTGLATIDYVLGDQWVLPPDEATHFVERAWRVPQGYLCFTPPEPAVAIAPAAGAASRPFTFGCFSDLVKVNERVVAVWARILHCVPDAQLFLKAQQLGDAAQREATLARFAEHGIEAERIVMEGASPRADYLDAYNRVDITLSPFPYPGGTTTAESLWMGVPVLCRRGDRFLGHLCESVVQSVGLGEWIAADEHDYVAKALAFAGQRAQLAASRKALRARVLASSLCDATRFARMLESEFAAMWQAYRRGGERDVSVEVDAPSGDEAPSQGGGPSLRRPVQGTAVTFVTARP
ncbi:tetratricopeptide repeat protein [Trinickia fusca]|uniref:protein O-GlcNAc transferase n=1 Tax=Trinickia fusca TaxID=2419777 RepID=A0A494X4G9_9BURK|nr:tetratricopeptide repeat protein [Trinickia fusca]RKP45608.1 tetratricopeptide repeat protein [Trinickia fusca]